MIFLIMLQNVFPLCESGIKIKQNTSDLFFSKFQQSTINTYYHPFQYTESKTQSISELTNVM